MYLYVYDYFLNEKKYGKVLASIERRITDLELNGKIFRISKTDNFGSSLSNDLIRGAKTIVAVGNDITLKKVVARFGGHKIPIAIIPVEHENNDIATALGVPLEGEIACEVLSGRRLENIDLGVIGDFYFLSNIVFAAKEVDINIDGQYSIEAGKAVLNIINLPPANIKLPQNIQFNPKDGILHLELTSISKTGLFSKKEEKSFFPFRCMVIKSRKGSFTINEAIKIVTPAKITVNKLALKVIVGKDRMF